MTKHYVYLPGDLVEIVFARDQNAYTKSLIGKLGIIVKHLTKEHGIISSANMYSVFVASKEVRLHSLDMKLVLRF